MCLLAVTWAGHPFAGKPGKLAAQGSEREAGRALPPPAWYGIRHKTHPPVPRIGSHLLRLLLGSPDGLPAGLTGGKGCPGPSTAIVLWEP